MSRRRNDAASRFAGTVHVSPRPQSLEQFYAHVAEDGPGLQMSVFR